MQHLIDAPPREKLFDDRLNMRMPPALKREVREWAERNGRPFSAVIREALVEHLRRNAGPTPAV